MKRAIREGFEAASAVFEAAGYRCHFQQSNGKGHPMCVAVGPLGTIRCPISGTPSGGDENGRKMAAVLARRQLRRLRAHLQGTP